MGSNGYCHYGQCNCTLIGVLALEVRVLQTFVFSYTYVSTDNNGKHVQYEIDNIVFFAVSLLRIAFSKSQGSSIESSHLREFVVAAVVFVKYQSYGFYKNAI